jgi:AraC-like DNA-binding protein
VLLPALLDLLLVQILRTWFASRNGDSSRWAVALGDPAIGAALRAVHTEPDRACTVDKLATRVGLSRAVFARRFTALVGQPPMAYLNWWRMTVAARLLREGHAPLAAIARQVGYASEYAFAHAFKRAFGSPPGAFRRAAPSSDPSVPWAAGGRRSSRRGLPTTPPIGRIVEPAGTYPVPAGRPPQPDRSRT